MTFLALIARNVFRRPVRSALTVAGVSIAIAAVVALLGAARMFRNASLAVYDGRGVDLVVVRAGVAQPATSSLPEKLEAPIAAVPGIEAVAPILLDNIAFEDLNLFEVSLQGWAPGSFMFDDVKPLAGRLLQPGDERRVMLGARMAANLGKQVGDTVEVVEDEPFEVVAIFESFNVFENSALVITIPELQRLMDRGGHVTQFALRASGVPDREQMQALCDAVAAVAPSLAVRPTREFVEGNSQVQASQGMALLTSIIAVLAGSIGMLNTMVMSVFERTREMGVLRAIGWRRGRVLRMILSEAICLAIVGAAIGAALAAGGLWLLAQVPMVATLLDGRLPVVVVLQGFAVAVLVGVAGGALPAWRASGVLPTEALRHE